MIKPKEIVTELVQVKEHLGDALEKIIDELNALIWVLRRLSFCCPRGDLSEWQTLHDSNGALFSMGSLIFSIPITRS